MKYAHYIYARLSPLAHAYLISSEVHLYVFENSKIAGWIDIKFGTDVMSFEEDTKTVLNNFPLLVKET